MALVSTSPVLVLRLGLPGVSALAAVIGLAVHLSDLGTLVDTVPPAVTHVAQVSASCSASAGSGHHGSVAAPVSARLDHTTPAPATRPPSDWAGWV